jgi:hypothetical protein
MVPMKAMGKTEQQYDIKCNNEPGNRLLVILKQPGLLFKCIPLTLVCLLPR